MINKQVRRIRLDQDRKDLAELKHEDEEGKEEKT